MIDETKFEKLEKEDMQEASGGADDYGNGYQITFAHWACMKNGRGGFSPTGRHDDTFKQCEYCIHFHGESTSCYARGYCDAIIAS